MEISLKKRQQLEDIVKGINDSEKSSLRDRVKKISYIPLAVYYGGILRRKYQKEFAERINWKEKNLTISNALFFGLGGSLLYYFGGDGAIGFFENLDVIESIENYIILGVADFLGVASKNILYSYIGFNTVQNLFRIGYSQTTGKSMASLSFIGAIANTGHMSAVYLRKRIPDVFEREACGIKS